MTDTMDDTQAQGERIITPEKNQEPRGKPRGIPHRV
jgi:hypothetical protein